jgi:SAM-dependent methyltransferase
MTWSLQFHFDPTVVEYFKDGKDEQRRRDECLSLFKKYDRDGCKCLQVGVNSETDQKINTRFMAIDLYDKRPCIDYNCDLADTHFKDETFDFIHCCSVLEHVKQPFDCAKEMIRILKKGGEIWVETPFVWAYHPTKHYLESAHGSIYKLKEDLPADWQHGGDYWRFTPEGLAELMKPLECVDVMLCDGGAVAYWGKKI